MKIVMASDHAGLEMRAALAERLTALGHEVEDLGPDTTDSVDYPDYAHKVIDRLVEGTADRGVLVCGTGQGMAMTANKVDGIRAAVVSEPFSARMAMLHNNAQVLCLGARVVGVEVALDCVEAWAGASFEAGRHLRRINKM